MFEKLKKKRFTIGLRFTARVVESLIEYILKDFILFRTLPVCVLDFDWFRNQTVVLREIRHSDGTLQRGPTVIENLLF